MWTGDATQHIHVEPMVAERDVLLRASEVARAANPGQQIMIDLMEIQNPACSCHAPAGWKTYTVIIHALVEGGQPKRS